MKTHSTPNDKILGYTNRLLIGLIISLSFTLTAFEYTSEKSIDIPEVDTLTIGEDDLILPPITYRMDKIEKPEPKPKTTTEMIIVENIESIESKIEVEVNSEEEPLDVSNIDWESLGMGEEILIEEEIPRTSAEVYANYGGCDGLLGSDSYDCSTQEIMRRIQENFDIPDELKSEHGTFRAFIQFIVDQEGNVINVEALK